MGWLPAFLAISLIYFYSHYFFASHTAHISAMYAAFLGVALAVGAPPLLAALVSVVNILIWLGLGGCWWKILGLW